MKPTNYITVSVFSKRIKQPVYIDLRLYTIPYPAPRIAAPILRTMIASTAKTRK